MCDVVVLIMRLKRFRIYTGPTIVNQVADYFKSLSTYSQVFAGTQHVHMVTDYCHEREDILRDVKRYGSGWTMSDIQHLGNNY